MKEIPYNIVVNDNNYDYENDKNIIHDGINNALTYNKEKNNFNFLTHEYLFILYLKKEVLQGPWLASQFLIFCDNFYLDYPISFNLYDPLSAVLIEINKMKYIVKYINFLKEDKDRGEKQIQKLLQFGEIATDFLIRVRGYSLINCSGQKFIITARNNCEKKFENYLIDGYMLQRKQQYVFKYNGLISSAYFEKRPVLPTKESYFPIKEIIEVNTNKYQRTLNWHFK